MVVKRLPLGRLYALPECGGFGRTRGVASGTLQRLVQWTQLKTAAVASVGWARLPCVELWIVIGGIVVWMLVGTAWDMTQSARQRTGRRLAAPVRSAVAAVKRRRLLWAQGSSGKLLDRLREMTPTSVVDRLPQGWGLVPRWVARWFYATQTAHPALFSEPRPSHAAGRIS